MTRYAPFIAPVAPEVSLKCPYNLNDNGEMSGEDLDDTNVELLSSSSKSKVDTEQTKYEYEDVVAIIGSAACWVAQECAACTSTGDAPSSACVRVLQS